ncbi:MAG: hypothetical protein JXB85_12160 [Anaerolineales bacterium]|nr:hypothetical protein [Anaerolineales bacterium]
MSMTTIIILLAVGLLFGAAAGLFFYLAFRPKRGQDDAARQERAPEAAPQQPPAEAVEEQDEAWDISGWVPGGASPTTPVQGEEPPPPYERADEDLQELLDRLEEYNATFPEREIFREVKTTEEGEMDIRPDEIRRLIWKLEQEKTSRPDDGQDQR